MENLFSTEILDNQQIDAIDSFRDIFKELADAKKELWYDSNKYPYFKYVTDNYKNLSQQAASSFNALKQVSKKDAKSKVCKQVLNNLKGLDDKRAKRFYNAHCADFGLSVIPNVPELDKAEEDYMKTGNKPDGYKKAKEKSGAEESVPMKEENAEFMQDFAKSGKEDKIVFYDKDGKYLCSVTSDGVLLDIGLKKDDITRINETIKKNGIDGLYGNEFKNDVTRFNTRENKSVNLFKTREEDKKDKGQDGKNPTIFQLKNTVSKKKNMQDKYKEYVDGNENSYGKETLQKFKADDSLTEKDLSDFKLDNSKYDAENKVKAERQQEENQDFIDFFDDERDNFGLPDGDFKKAFTKSPTQVEFRLDASGNALDQEKTISNLEKMAKTYKNLYKRNVSIDYVRGKDEDGKRNGKNYYKITLKKEKDNIPKVSSADILKAGAEFKKDLVDKQELKKANGQVLLGPSEDDGEMVSTDLLGAGSGSLLIAGDSGMGKGVFVQGLWANLVANHPDCMFEYTDMNKGGADFAAFENYSNVLSPTFAMSGKSSEGMDDKTKFETLFNRLDRLVRTGAKRELLFSKNGVQNIEQWNKKFPDKPMKPILSFFDEFEAGVSSLKDYSASVKEKPSLYDNFMNSYKRFLKVSRSSGVKMVCITQNPEASTLGGNSALKMFSNVITMGQKKVTGGIKALGLEDAVGMTQGQALVKSVHGYTKKITAPMIDEEDCKKLVTAVETAKKDGKTFCMAGGIPTVIEGNNNLKDFKSQADFDEYKKQNPNDKSIYSNPLNSNLQTGDSDIDNMSDEELNNYIDGKETVDGAGNKIENDDLNINKTTNLILCPHCHKAIDTSDKENARYLKKGDDYIGYHKACIEEMKSKKNKEKDSIPEDTEVYDENPNADTEEQNNQPNTQQNNQQNNSNDDADNYENNDTDENQTDDTEDTDNYDENDDSYDSLEDIDVEDEDDNNADDSQEENKPKAKRPTLESLLRDDDGNPYDMNFAFEEDCYKEAKKDLDNINAQIKEQEAILNDPNASKMQKKVAKSLLSGLNGKKEGSVFNLHNGFEKRLKKSKSKYIKARSEALQNAKDTLKDKLIGSIESKRIGDEDLENLSKEEKQYYKDLGFDLKEPARNTELIKNLKYMLHGNLSKKDKKVLSDLLKAEEKEYNKQHKAWEKKLDKSVTDWESKNGNLSQKIKAKAKKFLNNIFTKDNDDDLYINDDVKQDTDKNAGQKIADAVTDLAKEENKYKVPNSLKDVKLNIFTGDKVKDNEKINFILSDMKSGIFNPDPKFKNGLIDLIKHYKDGTLKGEEIPEQFRDTDEWENNHPRATRVCSMPDCQTPIKAKDYHYYTDDDGDEHIICGDCAAKLRKEGEKTYSGMPKSQSLRDKVKENLEDEKSIEDKQDEKLEKYKNLSKEDFAKLSKEDKEEFKNLYNLEKEKEKEDFEENLNGKECKGCGKTLQKGHIHYNKGEPYCDDCVKKKSDKTNPKNLDENGNLKNNFTDVNIDDDTQSKFETMEPDYQPEEDENENQQENNVDNSTDNENTQEPENQNTDNSTDTDNQQNNNSNDNGNNVDNSNENKDNSSENTQEQPTDSQQNTQSDGFTPMQLKQMVETLKSLNWKEENKKPMPEKNEIESRLERLKKGLAEGKVKDRYKERVEKGIDNLQRMVDNYDTYKNFVNNKIQENAKKNSQEGQQNMPNKQDNQNQDNQNNQQGQEQNQSQEAGELSPKLKETMDRALKEAADKVSLKDNGLKDLEDVLNKIGQARANKNFKMPDDYKKIVEGLKKYKEDYDGTGFEDAGVLDFMKEFFPESKVVIADNEKNKNADLKSKGKGKDKSNKVANDSDNDGQVDYLDQFSDNPQPIKKEDTENKDAKSGKQGMFSKMGNMIGKDKDGNSIAVTNRETLEQWAKQDKEGGNAVSTLDKMVLNYKKKYNSKQLKTISQKEMNDKKNSKDEKIKTRIEYTKLLNNFKQKFGFNYIQPKG